MYKQNLSNIALAIFTIAWFAGGFYYLMSLPKREVIVYDCAVAETSPEYPQQVKDECRKYRSGRI